MTKKVLKAVEKVIRDSIGWAKTKDFNLLYKLNSGDNRYLEVHPEDRVIVGFSEFKKMEQFWRSEDFKAINFTIYDLRINLSRNRDVAWWFCRLDDINEWKGQDCSWRNVRWTGVMEKRNGEWKILQMHFSYPEKQTKTV